MIPKFYTFSYKTDSKAEPIDKVLSYSRLSAAKFFAERKRINFKDFLHIFKVSK